MRRAFPLDVLGEVFFLARGCNQRWPRIDVQASIQVPADGYDEFAIEA
jgi:hypothetical protein